MRGKRSLTAELLALRAELHSDYEDRILDVLGKLYGLVSALQMQMRMGDFERSSAEAQD